MPRFFVNDTEEFGKTLGVVGMGRIGSGVAKRALAFEMNVIAYDPYINEERAKALGVKVVTFDELIEQSDFITVHMPLTPDTKGMIGMEQMKKMKKGVRLVNCARGGIIVEEDLAEAVKQGLVAGAAIDVYTSEPVTKDHPLVGVPGIVLTPHLGASTVEAQERVAVEVAEAAAKFLKEGVINNAINATFSVLDFAIFKVCLICFGAWLASLFSKAAQKLKPLFLIGFLATWFYLIWRIFFCETDD